MEIGLIYLMDVASREPRASLDPSASFAQLAANALDPRKKPVQVDPSEASGSSDAAASTASPLTERISVATAEVEALSDDAEEEDPLLVDHSFDDLDI